MADTTDPGIGKVVQAGSVAVVEETPVLVDLPVPDPSTTDRVAVFRDDERGRVDLQRGKPVFHSDVVEFVGSGLSFGLGGHDQGVHVRSGRGGAVGIRQFDDLVGRRIRRADPCEFGIETFTAVREGPE